MKNTHQTTDEIAFIRRICRREVEATARFSRADLLRGYLDGCAKRVRWDRIDRNAAEAAARAELNYEPIEDAA